MCRQFESKIARFRWRGSLISSDDQPGDLGHPQHTLLPPVCFRAADRSGSRDRPHRAVKPISRSQWNDGYGADSRPSGGGPVRALSAQLRRPRTRSATAALRRLRPSAERKYPVIRRRRRERFLPTQIGRSRRAQDRPPLLPAARLSWLERAGQRRARRGWGQAHRNRPNGPRRGTRRWRAREAEKGTLRAPLPTRRASG
jgi:hypothetical protein